MATDASIAARTQALVEQGELKQALKLLERERKQALSREDLASVEDVFAASKVVYGHADGKQQSEAGRISFAAQQNIRLLGRKAALAGGEVWVDPFGDPRQHSPAPADDRRSFLFGDPRRPRSLALSALASIGMLPVAGFAGFFLWGLSGDNSDGVATPLPADGGRHGYRVVVLLAAIIALVSLVGTTAQWARARKGYPRSERGSVSGREAVLSVVVVALALGAAVALFAFFWISTPWRLDLVPYTTP